VNKRQFLSLTAALALPRMARATTGATNVIKAAGTLFEWHHADTRLVARLDAPTQGWIAVGFNARPGLRNTRFIIADVSTQPIRVEEHLALVPAHREIGALGLAPAIKDARGAFNGTHSQLWFSLAHEIPGPPPLDLGPGQTAHVMLAWSQARDFNHHSAWRRHFATTM